MKPTTLAILAGAASTMIAAAGPAPDATVPLTAEKSEPWLVPTFDIRARYEYANIAQPFTGDSTAFTVRERVGLRVGAFFGFSAFAEYEGTQLIDNHFSTPFPTQPGPAPRTPIADPENNELNRAWVQWEGYESGVKLGRQRIILDNAAMIGNVGWRQNEQTYDAANLMVGVLENFEFRYVYIDRVLRIFGQDAEGATRNFAGDTHLIHAAWKGPQDFKLTGYAYLMDFDRTGQRFSNNTYGMIAEKPFDFATSCWSLNLRGEFAYQTDASSTPVDYDAFYGHLLATAKFNDRHTVGIGYEHLGADTGRNKLTGAPTGISFRTPLATAHAFNGIADALLGARVGGTPRGIGDLYATYSTMLPADFKLILALHWFGDDSLSFDTGWEADATVKRKINDYFTAIATVGWFNSNGDPTTPAPYDTLRATVEVDFVF